LTLAALLFGAAPAFAQEGHAPTVPDVPAQLVGSKAFENRQQSPPAEGPSASAERNVSARAASGYLDGAHRGQQGGQSDRWIGTGDRGTRFQKPRYPALWEVSDADSKVWLFGSVHVLPSTVTWRTATFDAALGASTHIYFEADVGPLGIIALVIKSIALGMSRASDDWVSTLSKDEQAKLTEALKPLGLSLEQARLETPWLLAAQIEGEGSLPRDYDPSKGVDMLLQWELPKERKAYFETVAQQMDILSAGTEAEQVNRLRRALAGGHDTSDDLRDLVSAWQIGDVAHLDEMIKNELATDPGFANSLLYDRNRNWVPTIEKLLATNEEDLIVVGAAHLAGDGSVLDLLAKAGFSVKRIQ